MSALAEQAIDCPYCGERIDILVDSSEVGMSYIEDCQVCCRPITMRVFQSGDDTPYVEVSHEDE